MLGCHKNIKLFQDFRKNFNTLYYHFSSSGVRTAKLDNIQAVLEDPKLKIKEPHSVRWLALRNAVEAVYKCYPSIVSALGEIGDTNVVAKVLYKYFSQSKICLLVSFMLDVQTQLAVLSTEFQRRNLLFSEIKPILEANINALVAMKDGGKHYKDMVDNLTQTGGNLKGVELTGWENCQIEISNVLKTYLDSLCENLNNRISQNNGDLLTDFGMIFEPGLFDEELADIAIEDLANFFGTPKVVKSGEGFQMTETQVEPLLNKAGLLDEWPMMKGMIKGTYKNLTTALLCKRIICLHENILPNSAILCKIALCIMVTSVECERSFSTQNRLKSRYRCSLKAENLDVLMNISMNGPEVSEYDVKPAANLWLKSKKRRPARLVQEFKKRKLPRMDTDE